MDPSFQNFVIYKFVYGCHTDIILENIKGINCLTCILLTQTLVRKYLRTQTHNVDIVINFNHRIKINGNGIKKNLQKYIYWLELSY